MSNPTELPDERSEFESAQRKYHWPLAEADLRQDKIGNYYNHVTQANWSMWSARAALARRAQPEGEAPQAVLVTPQEAAAAGIECGDTACGGCNAGEPWCIHAPAAQHAESGAPCRYCAGDGEHHQERGQYVSCNACDGTGEQRGPATAIAAQSQDTGLLKLALEQANSRIAQADARIEELEAAQSQGAQPNEFEVAIYDCALMLNLPRGAAAMDVCRAVNRLATAAQQAAAPGLTDADENAPWLTLAHIVCQDAGIEPGHITKRLEALRTKLESAPGTPEAPASLDLSHITSVVLQDRGSKSVIVRFGQSMAAATKFLDQFGTLVLSQRAAQLDGGQGEVSFTTNKEK